MRAINRNFSVILVLLFIIITSYVAVELFSLPEEILHAVGISENASIQKAERVISPIYIVLGIDLLLVLFIIFILSTGNISSKSESVVYVERDSVQKDQHQGAERQSEESLGNRFLEFKKGIADLSDNDHIVFLEKVFHELCNQVESSVGALYLRKEEKGTDHLVFQVGYAFFVPESKPIKYEYGEGVVGQVAKSGKTVYLDEVPDGYIKVVSGLGTTSPKYLAVVPMKDDSQLMGVFEIASFHAFQEHDLKFLEEVSDLIIEKLSTEKSL